MCMKGMVDCLLGMFGDTHSVSPWRHTMSFSRWPSDGHFVGYQQLLAWGRVKMRAFGADLEHGDTTGQIYRPIGVYAGLPYELADLQSAYGHMGQNRDLSYGLYRSAGLYIRTCRAVYGSILRSYHTDFADLCGCTYWLSGLKFEKTIHTKYKRCELSEYKYMTITH